MANNKIKASIKQELQRMMHAQINKQLDSLHQAKISIEESKRNETKSSAGDKFETGRAMMQMELDKLQAQLDQLNMVRTQLKQLDDKQTYDKVQLGALVITDKGNFYISVSLGKFVIEENSFFAISANAPLAKALLGKHSGDQIKFRDQKYLINKVY